MLQDLAEEYKFQILAMEVMPDHIHLLVYIEGQKEKEKSLTEEMVCWKKRDADSIQLWRRSTKTEYPDPPDTGTDPEVPEGTRLCAVTGKMGIYETPEYRAGKEDRRCNHKICRGKPCRCDRIRISGNAGEDIRKEKTETASVEKTGYPETL